VSTLDIELDGDIDDWTAGLPSYQQRLVGELVAADPTLESATEVWLSAGISTDLAPFGVERTRSAYYEKFLDELHDLLCVPNKYESEKGQLQEQAKVGQAAVVSLLTAVIVPVLGAAAPIVAPAIAITMILISRMGLNAWCAVQTERRQSRSS
jgi:hypothetical protein